MHSRLDKAWQKLGYTVRNRHGKNREVVNLEGQVVVSGGYSFERDYLISKHPSAINGYEMRQV